MEIPKQKTEPSKKWREQKFLMIGPGKIGKSAFWAEGEKTLFLECEPGLNHLAVFKVPIRSWEDFRQACGKLKGEGDKLAFDTIVIDTGDKYADLAGQEVVERANEKFSKAIEKGLEINSIGDVPEGGGWYQWTKLVHNGLDFLVKLNVAVVVISHYNLKEISTPTMKYNRETISIGGQCGTKLLHWDDHTLNVKAEMSKGGDLKRRIVTRPTLTIEAGSRGNIVPDGFELNGDMKANYTRFRALFTD